MTEVVSFFQIIQNINTVLIDFCKDMWEYASDGRDVIRYKKIEGNVGSSVMPQKVNPRQFEDGIGNLQLANASIDAIVRNSDISTLQRDMTGHAMERSYGEIFGKTLVGRTNIVEALKRVDVNEKHNEEELNNHTEIIGEGIQTILRREGYEQGYEIIKALLQGKKGEVQQDLQNFYTYL
jgi:adenylosuccinate lyase